VTPEEYFRMDGLLAYEWPVTWRYHVSAPFGRTQQLLTVDVPAFAGSIEHSQQLGLELWSRGLAGASTVGLELLEWDTVCWRLAPAALPLQAFGARGHNSGPSTGRDRAAFLTLETGLLDSFGFRRLCLPAIPESWALGNQLSFAGWDGLLTIAEGLNIGLQQPIAGGPYQWLIPYPELLPASPSNPSGVAFRKVTKVRVCSFLDRAPDPSALPFP
jgi:hypothetical protein